jgi:hypothetical protein
MSLGCKGIREYIDCSLARPASLVLVESWSPQWPLSVAPQSCAKDQFDCTVYYITLNWNCEAQRVPKNEKIQKIVRSQN